MACRICHEPNNLIQVCACTGTMKEVHKESIEKWQAIKNSPNCEICKKPYKMSFCKFNPIPFTFNILGAALAITQAFIISNITTHYPGDIYGTVLSSLFVVVLYSLIYPIMYHYHAIYTKISLVLWPITFFGTSIVIQLHGSGLNSTELLISYAIYLCCFFGWALYFFKFRLNLSE